MIRIATRGSALALAQARMVLAQCSAAFPREQFELKIIRTTGDRLQGASMQGKNPSLPKGLFTKELEVALLEGSADLAVHSLKDLPTELPDGLRLASALPRADVRDVLVTRGRAPAGIEDLPARARVATSSTRRAAQLKVLRPDLEIVEIRGNVPTRLRKLAEGRDLAATLLAAAGLDRLGIRIREDGAIVPPPDLADPGWGTSIRGVRLPVDQMLPAPAQAAIGLECRVGDLRIARICARLNDAVTRRCVEAERAFLAGFGGGCLSPVAALAEVRGSRLRLRAVGFGPAGIWRDSASGPVTSARQLGRRLGLAARRALLPA